MDRTGTKTASLIYYKQINVFSVQQVYRAASWAGTHAVQSFATAPSTLHCTATAASFTAVLTDAHAYRNQFVQEDEMLRQAVAKFGDRAWATVANDVPGRSSKSCSDRCACGSILGSSPHSAES